MRFDKPKHTGLSYGEDIPIIESAVTERNFAAYCQRTREQYIAITKQWTEKLNIDWFIRHYLAVKMFLAATVMMTSSRYATKKNLKIVRPYLLYYATLSCCRAVVFTLPGQPSDERLYEMSHSKTISVAVTALKSLSKTLATEVETISRRAQEQREMFCYKFPAQGLRTVDQITDWASVQRICRLLGEVAQLRSECLHAAVEKHAGNLPPLNISALRKCFEYSSLSGNLIDDDDRQRVSFWKRQKAGPYNLSLLATPGLVEDYFGSWLADETFGQEADIYDPDDDWRIIFPFH